MRSQRSGVRTMRRKEETFSSIRATTPLAAIMKSSISSVAWFFSLIDYIDHLIIQQERTQFIGFQVEGAMLEALIFQLLCNFILKFKLCLQVA